MFLFIIGGSASGKSEYAEKRVLEQDGEKIYLATMEPFGAEAKERIRKHRESRKNRGFQTVECYRSIWNAPVPESGNVLLEDLGNLIANEWFGTPLPAEGREGQKMGARKNEMGSSVWGIDLLLRKCRHLTVVSNEVFLGGQEYEGDTLAYMRELARVNRELARMADEVVEVVCGLPDILKKSGTRSGAY